MYKEDIISLLKDPALLNETDPARFNDIIAEHPLFTTARTMQLLAAARAGKEEFNDYLKRNASWINNFQHIRQLIKQDTSLKTVEGKTDLLTAPAGEASIENIPVGENSPNVPGIDYQEDSLLSFDFNKKKGVEKPETNEKSGHSKPGTEPSSINRKFELIDRFIATNPGSIRSDESAREVDFLSLKDSVDEDSLITDTLAKIYIKQGLYSKAIYSYEKLILKYPEKSVYFAAQIEEIKKLINK